jgi:hypothetical protein
LMTCTPSWRKEENEVLHWRLRQKDRSKGWLAQQVNRSWDDFINLQPYYIVYSINDTSLFSQNLSTSIVVAGLKEKFNFLSILLSKSASSHTMLFWFQAWLKTCSNIPHCYHHRATKIYPVSSKVPTVRY